MKIALDSYCYHRHFGEVYLDIETEPKNKLDFWQCIHEAVSFGIDGISIESFMLSNSNDDEICKLNNILDTHHIELVWAWGHPSSFGNGQYPKAFDDFKKHVIIVKKLDAKVMWIYADGLKTLSQCSWQDHKNAMLLILKQAAVFLILAVENHADLYTDEIVHLVKSIDSYYFGICLDKTNNLRMLEDPWLAIQKMAPYTKATHIKDIAAYQGNPKPFSFWPSVISGQGITSLYQTFQLLNQLNYQGFLTLKINYLYPQHTSTKQAIQHSLDYLKI